jgi:hypothetical protein
MTKPKAKGKAPPKTKLKNKAKRRAPPKRHHHGHEPHHDDKTIDMSDATNLAGQMAAYQKEMTTRMSEYEALIKSAQTELNAMVKTVNAPKAPPTPKAEAQWTESGGNRFLVLNESAAKQIMSIFDVVGALAEQLKKL